MIQCTKFLWQAETDFPKDIHVLISGIHDYYRIWKRVFADVIKLRVLKWGDDPGLSRAVPNAVVYILVEGRQGEI